MVARVADFEYIVTASEKEALLLESNLLKEHRPRYNIKLRDDKQYLYLKVGHGHPLPPGVHHPPHRPGRRPLLRPVHQRPGPAGGRSSSLQRLFQFRTCTLDMEKTYRRPCLLFHIKRCSGPCIREVTAGEYDEAVRHLILFLEGKHEEVLGRLRDEMAAAAEALSFERAAALRDRIAAAEKVAERQRVTSRRAGRPGRYRLRRRRQRGRGAGLRRARRQDRQPRGVRPPGRRRRHGRGDPDPVRAAVLRPRHLRPPPSSSPTPWRIPAAIEAWLTERRAGRVHLQVPQRGPKRQLLDLVQQNATEALERLKLKWLADERKTRGAVRELGEALAMTDPPRWIECYDISHIQGTSVVASMVVFEDGQPARHAYRRFRIKAGDQNDDFASMHEVIARRFRLRPRPRRGPATGAPAGASDAPDVDPDALAGAIESARDASVAERTGDIPADAGEAGVLATKTPRTLKTAESESAGAAGAGGGDRGAGPSSPTWSSSTVARGSSAPRSRRCGTSAPRR